MPGSVRPTRKRVPDVRLRSSLDRQSSKQVLTVLVLTMTWVSTRVLNEPRNSYYLIVGVTIYPAKCNCVIGGSPADVISTISSWLTSSLMIPAADL